ncbi:MAG: hypothetical protein DSY77_14670 [Bacteroidetes bacterium]|nr:MAG: hypothetical protein DSY77_14670 [Bacteroidota bacterium]
MEIKIRQIAIHYLEKEAKKTKADIDYSNQPIEKNDFATNLLEQVHNAINSSPSLKNATFKEDEENKFTKTLTQYIENPTEDKFDSFTHSLDLLKEKVEKEPFAKGGYYLFADYTADKSRYLSVILLRKKPGINIIKKGGAYVLDSTENINIEKIAMGLRLNFSIYNAEADDRNYLALITTQQDGEVSEYFKEWVLAAGLIKNSVNTENMIKIVKTIDLPVDDEGNELFGRGEFHRAVFEYVNNRKDKRINLFEIGEVFYGAEQKTALRDFADANGITIDSEFKRDAPKWKSLISIKASVPGININVDYDKFGQNGVEIKADKVIINSKELAALMQRQYDQY